MANKKHTEFVLQLSVDTETAKKQMKTMKTQMHEILTDISKDANNITYFKELVAYLKDIDVELTRLRDKHGAGIVDQIYGGFGKQLRDELSKSFDLDGINLSQFGAIRQQLQSAVNSGSTVELDKAKKLIKELTDAFGMPDVTSDLFGNVKDQAGVLNKTLDGIIKKFDLTKQVASVGFNMSSYDELSEKINTMIDLYKQLENARQIEDFDKEDSLLDSIADLEESIKKLAKSKEEIQELESIFDSMSSGDVDVLAKALERISKILNLTKMVKNESTDRAPLKSYQDLLSIVERLVSLSKEQKDININHAQVHLLLAELKDLYATTEQFDEVDSIIKTIVDDKLDANNALTQLQKLFGIEIPNGIKLSSQRYDDFMGKINANKNKNFNTVGYGEAEAGAALNDITIQMSALKELYAQGRITTQMMMEAHSAFDQFKANTEFLINEQKIIDKLNNQNNLAAGTEDVEKLKSAVDARNKLIEQAKKENALSAETLKRQETITDAIQKRIELIEAAAKKEGSGAGSGEEGNGTGGSGGGGSGAGIGSGTGNVDTSLLKQTIETESGKIVTKLGETLKVEVVSDSGKTKSGKNKNVKTESVTLPDSVNTTLDALSDQLRNVLKEALKNNDTKNIVQAINATKDTVDAIRKDINALVSNVNANKAADANAVKQAEISAMKQNLIQLLSQVTQLNNKTDVHGEPQRQEMSAQFMSNGTITTAYGEKGSIPWDRVIAQLINNLSSNLIMDIHSHPMHINKKDGYKYANDHFSGSQGDLAAWQLSKKLGAQMSGMLTGNILRTFNISELKPDKYERFIKILDSIERKYANDPTYSQYIGKKDDGSTYYKSQTSLEGRHMVTKVFEEIMYEALKQTGFSVDQINEKIFKQYDLTDDSQLAKLAKVLVNLNTAAQSSISPVQRLTDILNGLGVSTSTSEATTALLGFEKGEMSAVDVINRLAPNFAHVTDELVNSVQTIDSNNQQTLVESTLHSILDVLHAISNTVDSIQASIKPNGGDELSASIDNILRATHGAKPDNSGTNIRSIYDPNNISEYQVDNVLKIAKDAVGDTMSKILLSDGIDLGISEVNELVLSFKTALSYIEDAMKQVARYDKVNGGKIKTDINGVEQDATDFISNLRRTLLNVDDVINPLLSMLNATRKKIQSAEDAYGIGTVKTNQISSGNTSIDYQGNTTEISKERREIEELIRFVDQVRIAVDAKTLSFEKEDNVVQSVVKSEENQLDILESRLDKVTIAIDNNTKAFANGKTTVDSIVDAEINKLNDLCKKLVEVKLSISEIGQLYGKQTAGTIGNIVNDQNQEDVSEAEMFKGYNLSNAFKGMDLKGFIKRSVNKDSEKQLEDEFYKFAKAFIDEDADTMYSQASNIADFIVENSKAFRERKEENIYEDAFKAIRVAYTDDDVAAMGPQLFERAKSILGRRFQKLSDKNKHFDRIDQLVHTLASNYPSLFNDPDGNESAYNKLEQLLDPFDSWKRDGARKTRDVYLDENDVQGIIDYIYSEVLPPMMANIDEQRAAINAKGGLDQVSIGGFQDEQKDTDGIQQSSLANEIAQLENLRKKLRDVKKAITEKTEAFKEEGTVVDTVIGGELLSLNYLWESLDLVAKQIDRIVTGLSYINSQNIQAPNYDNGDIDELDVNKKQHIETQIDSSVKDYALDNTLQTTNSILNEISGKLNQEYDFSNLIEPLRTAAAELKNVADGVIQHQKAQKSNTSAAMAIISDPKKHQMIVDAASNSIGDLGSDVQIKGLKALANGIVSVEGAFKNANDEWEGFTVKVNESNKAVDLAINKQSAFAKALSKVKVVDERAEDNPHKISASETEKRAFLHAMGYADQGEDVTIRYQDNERYTVALRKNIGALQKEVFQTFDDGIADFDERTTVTISTKAQAALKNTNKFITENMKLLGDNKAVTEYTQAYADLLQITNEFQTTDDLSDSAIEKWNQQIDLVNNLGTAISNLIKIEQNRDPEKEAKKADDAVFSKMKEKKKNIGKYQTNLAGLDEKSEADIPVINEIKETLVVLNNEYAELENQLKKPLSTEQLKELSEIAEKTADDIRLARAKMEGSIAAKNKKDIKKADDDAAKRSQKEIDTAFSEMEKKKKAIGALEVALAKLDKASKKDAPKIEKIANVLERLNKEYSELEDGFGEFLSGKQVDKLNSITQDTTDKIGLENARKEGVAAEKNSSDAAKKLKSDFEKLKSLAKEMGKIEAQITESKDEDEVRGLTNILDKLKTEYEELYSITNKKLDPAQINTLNQIFADTIGTVRELKKEMADLSTKEAFDLELFKSDKDKKLSQFDLDKTNLEKDGPIDAKYDIAGARAAIENAEDEDQLKLAMNAWSKLKNEIKQAAIEAKRLSDVQKEAKAPQEKFKADYDAQLDAFNKYKKNLEGAGYLTTELSNKVEELKSKLVSIDNAADLTEWQKEFQKLGHEIDVAKAKWTGQHNDSAKKYNKQIEDAFKGLGFSTTDSNLSADQQEVVQAYHKAKEVVAEYKQNVKEGNRVEVSEINATIEALERKAKAYKVNNNIADVSAKKFGATAVRREATRAHKMQSLVFDLDRGYSSSDEFMKKYHEYAVAYDKLIDKQREFAGLDSLTNEQVAEWDRLKDTCAQAGKELERLYNASEKLKNKSGHSELLGEDFVDSEEGRKRALTDYVKSLIDADIESIKFKNDYTKCVAVVKESDGTFKQVSATIDTFGNQMAANIDDLGKSTSTLGNIWDEFKRKVSGIGTYLMAMFGFEELIQQFRQGISYVREIDVALTDLKKVTSGTEEEYKAFLQSMSKTASVVGSTVSDLTTMSAEWARLGYSMKEAGELAESTAILLNVSEFEDATTASEALISTMQAFGYAVNESQHVVDILNEVGNNYAVSSDGLATALQDSASALMESGNNLEQAVALVAAANKVVQDPNSVGSALRTISLRIRGTSVEVLEQLGEETEGVVESTSKLQEKIKALTGVDILTDSGAYKDTYTILKDIGEAWANIDPMDQAAALELLAGKNRANTLAAILNNTKDLENAYKSAMNAEGSALKENETYLDSIQGHVDVLTNSIQTMWMNFIDSDVAKFLVDVVNGLVKLIDTIGVIPSLSFVFSPLKSTLDDIKKAFKEIDDAPVKAIKLFTVATENGTAATMKDTLALNANAVATKANTVATKALAVAKNVVKGLAIGAIVAGITAGVSYLINVITEAAQRMEKLTDQAINSAKETKDLQDSTSDYKLEIKQLRKELDNNALSEAEAYDARSRLIDIQNELIDKFGLEAEGLNLVTGAIGDQINAIDELSKKSASDWMKKNVEAYENAKKVVAKTYDSDREITLFNQFGPDTNNLIGGTLISTSEEVIREYKNGLEKIIKDQYGGTIEEAEFASDHYGTTQYTKYIKASFDGKTVEQLDKILDDIQTYMLEFEESYDGANLSAEIANIQKLRDKYADEEYKKARELYEEGRQQEAISQYADAYSAILDAQEAIYDADTDESRLKAIEEYNKKIEVAKNQRTDDAYMDDYFDGLAEGFAEQEFELRLKVSKDDEDSLRAQLENIVKESGENGLSSLDNTAIFDMINRDLNVYGATDISGKYTQEQINGLVKLQTEADKAGISIQDLINILVNFGIIAGKPIEETTEFVSAIGHAYSTLASSVEQYASANEILNDAVYDNVEITQEQYDTLKSLIGSEEEFADCFDNNNKLIIKNSSLLRKLVAQKKQDQKATINQAKSQAQLQYQKLVQQMNKSIYAMGLEVSAYDIVDSVIRENISLMKDQIKAIEQSIQQYALLELSLTNAANAYNEFEKAKERDSQMTYDTSFEEMLKTIDEGLLKNETGTEAFEYAVKAIVPEEFWKDIDDVDEKIKSIHDYIDGDSVFSKLFHVDKESGDLDINADNVREFVNMGLKNGVFDGDSSEDFDLSDKVNGIEDVAEAYGITEAAVLAMFTALEKVDAKWGDVLTQVTMTAFDRDVYSTTKEMAELNVQLAEGTISVTEYAEKMAEATKNMDDYTATAKERLLGSNENVDEYSKWLLEERDAAAKAGYDGTTTQFGNIDTNDESRILEWTEQNLAANKKALLSWEQQTEESIDEAWTRIQEEFQNSYSTVLGSHGNYEGIDIAFSPILQTENGPVLIEADTLDKYIFALIKKAKANGKEPTYDVLMELDKEGLEGFEQGGNQIKGVLADVGETAKQTSEIMHFAGEIGSLADLENAVNESLGFIELNKKVAAANDEVTKATEKLVEAQKAYNEAKESGASDAELQALQDDISAKTKEVEELTEAWAELVEQRGEYPTSTEISLVIADIDKELENAGNKFNQAIRDNFELDENGFYVIKTGVDIGALEKAYPGITEYIKLCNTKTELQAFADTTKAEEDYEQLKTTVGNVIKAIEENLITMELDEKAVQNIVDQANEILGGIIKELGVTISASLPSWLKSILSWLGFDTSNTKQETINPNGSSVSKPKSKSNTNVRQNTIYALGNAYASGNVGLKNDEHNSIVGELGPELVCDPIKGVYYTVGEDGTEIVNLPKGAIIYNHKQTEELLRNGRTTRGQYTGGLSFASGNAYGSLGIPSHHPNTEDKTSFENGTSINTKWDDAVSSLSNAADSISDAADEFREVFDWVEVRLEELEETLGLLNAQLDNASNYSAQNNIVDSIIGVKQNKMDNLAAGIAEYAEYASKLLNEVPAQFREAAQNGAIAITDFAGEANEATVEAISNYREWAQKVADLKQQLEETKTEIRDLARQKFDNIYEAGDVRATVEDSQTEKLQNAVDLIEESGKIATEEYYLAMMENSNKTIEYLTKTRDEMQKVFNEAVEAGIIIRGSNEWYEMVDQLYQVDAEIDEATRELEEFQNAINNIYWDNFDQLINRIGYLKEETQNLIDLMDSDDMFTTPDKGRKYEGGTIEYWTADDVNWTDEGLASLGLYAQQMEMAEFEARQYAEAIDNLTADYEAGLYSENEYLEKLDELKNAQYESIEAYEEAKDAIVDLNKERIDAIKDGIEKEIDAYEELINKKKEALDSEKDLYDFQKSTMEQEKNIAEIERQLAALANDNSLSAAAKRKQLEAELAEAQYELQDTYYNRSVEDKQSALDKELEDFQAEKEAELQKWDEYLTNVEIIVAESLGIVQENATGIYDTLMAKAEEYDLTISDAIMTPWQDGAFAVSDYQEQFGAAMSSTMEQLEALKNKWQEVIDKMLEASKAEVGEIHKENNNYASAEKKQEQVQAPSTTPAPSDKPKEEKKIAVGGKINAKGAKIYSSIGGKGYNQYYSNDPIYLVLGEQSGYLKVRHHKASSGVTGWFKKSDVKAYAKGSIGVNEDQWALLDELGEELQLIPGKNGRLEYVKKGTGIIPANLTERLMNLAMNPQEMLDRNRPSITPSKSIINTEIKLDCSVGTLVNIEHCDQNTLPDVEKLVNKAFDKHMQNLNNSLKRYTR